MSLFFIWHWMSFFPFFVACIPSKENKHMMNKYQHLPLKIAQTGPKMNFNYFWRWIHTQLSV
jgi:hypothetical protein